MSFHPSSKLNCRKTMQLYFVCIGVCRVLSTVCVPPTATDRGGLGAHLHSFPFGQGTPSILLSFPIPVRSCSAVAISYRIARAVSLCRAVQCGRGGLSSLWGTAARSAGWLVRSCFRLVRFVGVRPSVPSSSERRDRGPRPRPSEGEGREWLWHVCV